MTNPITNIFVYGTLKRGQVRERMWPCQPISIEEAWVRGRLYDLGPYPGLLPPEEGSAGDPIAGEVWSFSLEQMPEVLCVLDQIEGYNQPHEEPNWYIRVEIDFATASGRQGKAFTYHYARRDPRFAETKRIRTNERGSCCWPQR